MQRWTTNTIFRIFFSKLPNHFQHIPINKRRRGNQDNLEAILLLTRNPHTWQKQPAWTWIPTLEKKSRPEIAINGSSSNQVTNNKPARQQPHTNSQNPISSWRYLPTTWSPEEHNLITLSYWVHRNTRIRSGRVTTTHVSSENIWVEFDVRRGFA